MSDFPPPTPTPPSGPKSWLTKPHVLIPAIAIVGVLAVNAQSDDDDDRDDRSGCVDVSYNMKASQAGDYTISTPDGTQQGSFDKSHTEYLTCVEPGEFLYVSIQNDRESGTVSCEIRVAGQTVASNSSTGAFVIATCEA